jgi:hypothetical protein
MIRPDRPHLSTYPPHLTVGFQSSQPRLDLPPQGAMIDDADVVCWALNVWLEEVPYLPVGIVGSFSWVRLLDSHVVPGIHDTLYQRCIISVYGFFGLVYTLISSLKSCIFYLHAIMLGHM